MLKTAKGVRHCLGRKTRATTRCGVAPMGVDVESRMTIMNDDDVDVDADDDE